jgi:hypothetical protein
MKTIYVGMALTAAPVEFRDTFQHELKAKLRLLPDVEVLDFSWTKYGPDANSNISVYQLDKENAEKADLCVFILDYPSLGLGMEIMIRDRVKKPSLFFVHKEPINRTSRMILGYIEETEQSLCFYQSTDEIVSEVREAIVT